MSDPIRLLLDEHMRPAIAAALREKGVDVVHVEEIGLKGAEDVELMQVALAREWVIVTRDHTDFLRLSEQIRSIGRTPAGLLLISPRFHPDDVGSLIGAVAEWAARVDSGTYWWTVGSIAWLAPASDPMDRSGDMVREAPAPYARALERIGA